MAKSVEIQFNEALDSLKQKQLYEKFEKLCPSGGTIESKLNVANSILNDPQILLEVYRERQYKTCLSEGMSEAEARATADLCGKPR
jgi:hypothetical protein